MLLRFSRWFRSCRREKRIHGHSTSLFAILAQTRDYLGAFCCARQLQYVQKVVVYGIDVLEGDLGSGGGMVPETRLAGETATSIRATELHQVCSVPVHVDLPSHVLKFHALVERRQELLLRQKSCVGGAVGKSRKISLFLNNMLE